MKSIESPVSWCSLDMLMSRKLGTHSVDRSTGPSPHCDMMAPGTEAESRQEREARHGQAEHHKDTLEFYVYIYT